MTEITGKLVLVPTPIGNLGDMTFRGVEVLKNSDMVLAEDTRHAGKLLMHFGIQVKVESLHQNNEHFRVPQIVQNLLKGQSIAYCSDAGTPGISDPGYLLVKACIDNGIAVECLPGATAFVPALVSSGLPSDRFVFEGFLPHKKGRQKRWDALQNESRTIVLYESPHRIFKLLQEVVERFGGDKSIAIARELSKIHETYYRGRVEDVITALENDVAKGEFVVVLSGSENHGE